MPNHLKINYNALAGFIYFLSVFYLENYLAREYAFLSKPMWRNGRRGRLKIYSWQQDAGSSPAIGISQDTSLIKKCPLLF
jgi:hypothetical protein